MTLFDSDFLIAVLRGEGAAAQTLRTLEAEHESMGTTVINAYELLLGALLHRNADEKRREVERLLHSLALHSLTPPASSLAAEISAQLTRAGTIIDFQDIAIAAIAIANDETLCTRNLAHFSRIKGLSVKKW